MVSDFKDRTDDNSLVPSPVVLTDAADMPWPVTSPFRMYPGLSRKDSWKDPGLFTVTAQDSLYRQAKREMLQAGYGQVGEPDPQVLGILSSQYEQATGLTVSSEPQALAATLPEDFVILHDEPDSHQTRFRVRFLSVCFASNWDPQEKLGLDFEQIHAPVADNRALLDGRRAIEALAFRQQSVRRFVWLLTPSSQLPLFPGLRATAWDSLLGELEPADPALLERVVFRVECQTTLPLPEIGRAVFLIRVMVCPLAQVLRQQPGRARELALALASMSDAVVAYRGMTNARERVLSVLERVDGQTDRQ